MKTELMLCSPRLFAAQLGRWSTPKSTRLAIDLRVLFDPSGRSLDENHGIRISVFFCVAYHYQSQRNGATESRVSDQNITLRELLGGKRPELYHMVLTAGPVLTCSSVYAGMRACGPVPM